LPLKLKLLTLQVTWSWLQRNNPAIKRHHTLSAFSWSEISNRYLIE